MVADRIAKFSSHNRLMKRAMWALADTLKPDEIQGMRIVFNDLDKDQSGTLTVDELRGALERPEYGISAEHVAGLLRVADLDGNRVIDWKEFLAATVDKMAVRRQERLWHVFGIFDGNGDGCLDRDEVRQALAVMPGTAEADVEEVFAQMDEDQDGQISFQEFAKAFYAIEGDA